MYHPSVIIGKGVTATIDTWPLIPTSWNWSVGGGNPFTDYSTTPANSSAPDSSTYVGLTGLTSASPHFYFAKPTYGNATVTCSAHLAVPSGSQPAGGLDVTGHLDCSVDKPSNTVSVYIGTVQFALLPGDSRLWLMQWGAPPYGGTTAGIIWAGTVTTPFAYSEFGNNPGGWNYTQLWTPNRNWAPPVNGTTGLPSNGQQGLDNYFGYQPWWPNLYPDVGTEHVTSDAPGNTLMAPMTWQSMNDSFATYTLYRPPGTDTKLVALKNWNWFASGAATWNGSAWVLSNAGAQWGFGDDFPPQPIWTRRNTNY